MAAAEFPHPEGVVEEGECGGAPGRRGGEGDIPSRKDASLRVDSSGY